MGSSRVTICLSMLACLISLIEASGFQTQNHETSSSFKSSSGIFGLKTPPKQTGSSTSGTFTNILKQSDAPVSTANPLLESTQAGSIKQEQELFGNNNFRSIDHSFGQDDTVYGLLPAENLPETPVNFGTRIQSRSNDPDCQVKGGCSPSHQSSVSEFGGSSSANEQTHQEQSNHEDTEQNDDKSVQSFVEQRENTDNNIQQQNQDDQYSDDGSQRRSMIFDNGFFENGQFDNTFRNFGLEEVNDNPQIPIVDSDFSDPGNNQQAFQEEDVSLFQDQDNQRPEDTAHDSAEERQNPTYFDYVDQQSYLDGPSVDQVSEAFDAVPAEEGNTPFQRNTGGHGRDIQFNQGGFQQPFSPQQSFATNENSNDFQDNGQDLFLNEDPIQALRYNVPGSPGEDYPIFYKVPETSFDCNQQQFAAGIYGDVDAQCQVFHFCKESGGRDSFLCPNGTVFNQKYFVCDWWYNYNCADTPGFYNLNAQLYWDIDSLSPTQILSGTGLGPQEDESNDQLDNPGGFAIQGVGSGTHIQAPSTNTQPIRNIQQSFDAKSSFEEDTRHSSSGFVGQRDDVSFQQDSSRSISEKQRNFAHSTSFSFQGSSVANNLRNNPAQIRVDTLSFPNDPVDIDSNVDDVSQIHIDSEDFRQVIDQRAPVPTNFEHQQISRSDENLNSRSITTQNVNRVNQFSANDASKVAQVSITNEQFESSEHSTSSDSGRNQQPGSDTGTQFPDQNGFEQQQVQDERQVQSNLRNQGLPNQVKLDELSPGFKNVDFLQETQKDITSGVTSSTFQDDNQSIQHSAEVFQQAVDFPLEEGRARSDENSESVKDPSGDFTNGGFHNENGGSVEQQKLDSVFENNKNNIFNKEATFSSNDKSVRNDDKTPFDNPITQVVDNSQTNQVNVQEQQTLEELLIPNVSDESDITVNEEKQANINSKSSFDQKKSIDVSNINQEAVNFEDILDGFQDRNVAFKNAGFEFQPTGNDKSVNENIKPVNVESGNQNPNQGNNNFSQKPVEEVVFTTNKNNKNINQNVGQNSQTGFFQQKLQENNIYSMMRGFPNNAPVDRSRPYPDQQRFNFRPYGQNGTPTLNSNIEVHNQNSERLQRNQNVQISQQNFQEQIIFPNAQYQRNAENQPWQNSQQRGNFYSGNFPNQQLRSVGIQSQQQLNQNFNRPSNKNWNVPTNGHQIRTSDFGQGVRNDPNSNRNIIPQTIQQNFNNGNQAFGRNTQTQIQNVPQPNIRSLSNEGPVRNQRVKGVVSPVQSQFNPAQVSEGNFNVQQIPQQNRNEQPQGNFNSEQTIPQNKNVGQVNPNSVTIGRQQEISGVKGRFSQSQTQFRNAQFNSGNIPNQNIPQIIQANVPEQNRQSQFQRNAQVNIENLHNANRQQIVHKTSEEKPSRGQFQNSIQFNSVNIPNNNNQQFVQQNIHEHRQDQFQNTVSFNSGNLPNQNDPQFANQNIKEHGQGQFQNNVPFHSVNVPIENTPQFVQQDVQDQEQGQFNNVVPFNSGNIPTENNQQFIQQEQHGRSQFQNADQFNSGNTPNGNNQQFVLQNRPVQQEEFQHSQFEQQARNEQSHIQSGPQVNIRDNRGSQGNSGTKGHFAQERPLFQNGDGIIPSHNRGQDLTENAREGRSNFNDPNVHGRIQPQKIDASDAIKYSHNEPPAAASSASYNGWRPIIRN